MSAVAPLRRHTWGDYELAKRDWVRLHPEATPEQIAAACRRIAEEMGL